jgi:hypothetical protein
VLIKLIPFIRHKQAVFKVDVQGAEVEIFQRKTDARFFEEIDVAIIKMELRQYLANYNQAEDRRHRVYRFLKFFYQTGYNVYDPSTKTKLDAGPEKWSYDVLFKKEDLPTVSYNYMNGEERRLIGSATDIPIRHNIIILRSDVAYFSLAYNV